jgi:hypothetical protein
MGDCRIRIVIAKSLFGALPDDLIMHCDGDGSSVRVASNKTSVSFVRMHSADTTIREVVDANPLLRKLYFDIESSPQTLSEKNEAIIKVASEFNLWDCTLSPPKDITPWPSQDYPDLQGPKSKTLHSAGLFPSGTWMAIPKEMTPSNFSDYNSNAYVDVQYNSNTRNENTDSSRRVEFNDPTLRDGYNNSVPLPSHVMEAVSNRFAAEDREEERKRLESSGSSAIALRRENIQRRAQKDLERATKLERRIALLEEQSKNSKPNKKKKVSDQVLRMLVKSRATGDKNLKEQDRLYFQCLVLVDDNADTVTTASDDSTSSKEYRYFSPQDTFAKIANSFLNGPNKKEEVYKEVICKRSVVQLEETLTTLPVYRRFPVTMRVYEAISQGYLSLSENIANYFDNTLIIRCYKDREDPTPLFEDETILDSDNSNQDTMMTGAAIIAKTSSKAVDKKIETASSDTDTTTKFEDTQLSDAIREMDEADSKGAKKATSKKKSAALIKVKQMKVKSKAKGNKKLKVEDRVFLEVISISETGRKPICESYFLSRNDPIERILQFIGTGASASAKSAAEDWEFLLPQEDSTFQPITKTSILMKEAEEKEILKSFDRIILRRKTT